MSQHFKSTVTALFWAVGFSLPALAQGAAPGAVDDLFERLRDAEPGQSERIVAQIVTEWSKSGSAAIDLLVSRGQDALDAGDPAAALDHFSAAVDHAPDFAEAYHGRATAYYLLDMPGPALDDLREVLVRNPRHFLAMQGLAVLLQEIGREAEALEVLRQVLAMNPQDADVTFAVEQLELMLEGQAL